MVPRPLQKLGGNSSIVSIISHFEFNNNYCVGLFKESNAKALWRH